jgi:site-specific DNA-methyltransferase (adenine-specific)
MEVLTEPKVELISHTALMDNMQFMAQFPDKFFDLAVVDPEYGIGINHSIGRRKGQKSSPHKKVTWDNSIPEQNYFNELFRISKNQIIWGGNYFTQYLKATPCWLLWDKGFSEDLTFSQFEMAWTSFDCKTKKFDKHPNQNIKIHPTQKPVSLYDWTYKNFATPGMKVIDTHLGSGSNRIAAYKAGMNFWACEIDEDYYRDEEKRFADFKAQTNLFY